MLTLGLHVRDTNSYVKCLGISHSAAILEKVRHVPIYFSRPSVILEKVRDVPIYFSRLSVIFEKVRDVPIPLLLCQKSKICLSITAIQDLLLG